MNNFDDLLEQVMDEARRADIPISKKIFPHIKVNSRAKSRFGRCIRENDGRFMIELSSRLYDAPEHSCRQTLAHELIHTCEGCMNHGELFRRYAEKMNRKYGYNIKRTNSAEEMGVESGSENGKYIVVCKKCGKEIRRTRQSPLTKNPSLTVVSGSSYGECPTGAPLGLLPWGANDQIFDLVTILYSPLFFV